METILLVTNIPTPYRLPLFNRLSALIGDKGCRFKVVFCEHGYARRRFELKDESYCFEHEFLDGGTIIDSSNIEKTYFLYRGLWKVLRREHPSKIIVAGFSPATVKVFCWSLLNGTPFYIWSGTINRGDRNAALHRRLLRKILISRAAGFIAYGSMAKSYLESLGADTGKIAVATNAVDTEFFSTRTEEIRKKEAGKDRNLFNFIYVGYLVPRKQVEKVLHAAELLSKRRKDFRVTIVGEGESRASLENACAKAGLDGMVRFEGYQQKEDLPAFLANADAFLFQTGYDIWGLVLNEAMAAGLPVISSPNAGSTCDLVIEGETGFIADYNDTAKVVDRMEWMMDNRDNCIEIGKKAREHVSRKASLQKAAESFISALNIYNTTSVAK